MSIRVRDTGEFRAGRAYADVSGSITAGGTAQTVTAASVDRLGGFVSNPNASGSLWVNFLGGTSAANAAGSVEVIPGQVLNFDSTQAVTIVHATTAAKFTAGVY